MVLRIKIFYDTVSLSVTDCSKRRGVAILGLEQLCITLS
jgi:hypothetical protein